MSLTNTHKLESELLTQIEKAKNDIELGAFYTHYRDLKTTYKVIGFGIIEATEEPSVLYQRTQQTDPITWIRTVKSWLEPAIQDNRQVTRFTKLEDK